jgi:poly-gamma-glutamate capsule biosynthesis protein CapA/YwtB (metallophosphatase superfamily)
MLTIALAGDTMLGRKVAEVIGGAGPDRLFDNEILDISLAADLFVLNLECCISERGVRWPEPRKPFFFRAPAAATEVLRSLGVDCVTLANNHALDYGVQALEDTFEHLRSAGLACVGAGRTRAEARAPVVFEANGVRVGMLGCSDHPRDFAAGVASAGIAYADLRRGPDWLPSAIAAVEADVVLVIPT